MTIFATDLHGSTLMLKTKQLRKAGTSGKCSYLLCWSLFKVPVWHLKNSSFVFYPCSISVYPWQFFFSLCSSCPRRFLSGEWLRVRNRGNGLWVASEALLRLRPACKGGKIKPGGVEELSTSFCQFGKVPHRHKYGQHKE